MIKINPETKKPECEHNTSLPNMIKTWPMKPYKIEKDGVVIEEGYFCPRCHRLYIEEKQEKL